MAAEWGVFSFGGADYPLTSSTANSLLFDADPALYYALGFWASVLNTHLSARLVAEALLCGAPITAAVKSTANYDVGPYLLEHPELTLPVLAVYRFREEYRERTLTWDHAESTWKIEYVLPAFQNFGGISRIKPIQHAVGQVLHERTAVGWDAGYLSGARIFGAAYAAVETIDIMDAEYGRHEDGTGIYFESMILTARVRERVMAPPAGTNDPLTRVDVNYDDPQAGQTAKVTG